MAATPDTIVLIHGFWVTPRSWEDWMARYESHGYRVLAPAYPGFEVEVEALNADPTPIEELTVPAIIEHLESVVRELDAPPILMGHSAGGVFTQQLMDHGYGAAGVAINSAPTEGVRVVPLSQIKATFPVLKNPANRHKAVGFTLRAVALRVHKHVQRGGGTRAVRALPHPGFRARLLGKRAREHPARPRTTPTSTTRTPTGRRCCSSLAARTTSCPRRSSARTRSTTSPNTITEIKEYEGRAHLMPAETGWEEIADYVLDWAIEHAKAPTTVSATTTH